MRELQNIEWRESEGVREKFQRTKFEGIESVVIHMMRYVNNYLCKKTTFEL